MLTCFKLCRFSCRTCMAGGRQITIESFWLDLESSLECCMKICTTKKATITDLKAVISTIIIVTWHIVHQSKDKNLFMCCYDAAHKKRRLGTNCLTKKLMSLCAKNKENIKSNCDLSIITVVQSLTCDCWHAIFQSSSTLAAQNGELCMCVRHLPSSKVQLSICFSVNVLIFFKKKIWLENLRSVLSLYGHDIFTLYQGIYCVSQKKQA